MNKNIPEFEAKIFKSNESYPSQNDINEAINELNVNIENNNIDGIIKILKKHVEGFNDKKNI